MIDLIKQGNSAVFTATEGEFPYSNGKIAVPLGSLTYVIDESERIDFKSAYNGNIVTTSTIGSLMVDGEIVTKDNAIEKLDAVIGGTSGGGGSDPRVDQLIKDVAKKQDKLNNITEIPDEAIFVGKLNDEGQPIGGVVAVAEDGVVQIEASDFSVGKDGESYIYANGEDVSLNGNVTVNDSTVLTEASVKTINGESIVGEGDIEIKGGADIKGGEGIYITEDSEGAKVISTEPPAPPTPPNNQIYYKTTDGNVLTPYSSSDFGYSIVSNEYDGDYGVITFGGNITRIGTSAFTNCTTLEEIYFSKNVDTVKANAFQGCSNLIRVNSSVDGELNMSFTSSAKCIVLNKNAFYGCTKLTSANLELFRTDSTALPRTIKRINSSIDGIANISVSGSVNFEGCDKIVEVNITSNKTKNVTLSDRCFYSCSNLVRVNSDKDNEIILNGYIVGVVGGGAFYHLKPRRVEIVNVTNFGNTNIFNNCSNLERVIMHPTVVINSSSISNPQIFPNGTTPTEGVLCCDEDWFNNLTSAQINRLGNVANWTRKPIPIPTSKPLDERVDDLDERVTALEEGGGGSDPRVDKLVTDVNTISGSVNTLNEKVDNIELVKSPNVTIVGSPLINQGQVSYFGVDRYLQFPFIVDLSKYNSQVNIDFSFTTNDDVTSQQNILDSQYGIAFAVRDSRFVVVASENGTSWTSGEVLSEAIVQPNTTYYIRLSCLYGDMTPYNIVCRYSLDKATYTEFGWVEMNSAPYPRTIIIGKNYFDTNYFKGSINLNDAEITVLKNVDVYDTIWQGMDDVGLSTRASVTLDNIDADGEAKINEVMKLKTINGLSIKGEGNIDIQGGGGGSYLPLSGGTLNGNLTLGDTAETSYRKVESIRNTNSQANGAAFYVNSDGTSAFFHKAYNGASATNDAILKFDATSLQFAKGGSRGTTASDFKKVILEDMFTYDPSTKTLDINFI